MKETGLQNTGMEAPRSHEQPRSSPRSGMTISAVVPCYNEQDNIAEAHRRISAALLQHGDYEIIFVDDGSTDDTFRLVEALSRVDKRVKYISFTRNFGQECAFRMGFRYSRSEWCIQYDADLQSPPEESGKLIQAAGEGHDIVYAIRENRQDPLYKVLGSKVQHYLARSLFGIRIVQGASVFRIVKRSIAQQVINYPARELYFLATVPLVTSSFTTVLTKHLPRKHGQTKWNLIRSIRSTMDLYFGFSYAPLKAIWFFAALSAVVVGLLYTLDSRISQTALSHTTTALLLLNLLSLGIIGEYLRRPASDIPFYKKVFVRKTNIPECAADYGLPVERSAV